MNEAKLKNIPNFIEASTKKRLRSLLKKNNVRLGGHVKYFDFNQEISGRWSCWFYDEVSDYEIAKEQLGIEDEGDM